MNRCNRYREGLFKAISVLILLCVIITLGSAQDPTTSSPPSQLPHSSQNHWQHQRRPVTATRYRTNASAAAPAAGSASTSPCDYKEVLTTLNDRVSLMVTVDEDLRNRLDNVENKITQFETSNLARIDSLSAAQMDFGKRLDVMEHIQRLTRHGVDALLGDFEDFMQNVNSTQITNENSNNNNNHMNMNINNHSSTDLTDVDMNVVRKSRQAERRAQEQQQQQQQQQLNPTTPIAVSDSQKLDALATLLTSTRSAINLLQGQLAANVTRLMQQNGSLQRRFNNFMRRQQQSHGFYPTVPNFYATANTQQQLVTSCAQGFSTTNGILKLQLTPTSDPFYVTCDDQLAGGGWTVIMNRLNGDINFLRGWMEYRNGFGNLAGEFFIGLDKLYALTASAVHELLITLEDFEGRRKYARYNLFAIGNEQESYELKLLGTYEGDAGDSLSYHAGSKFSTFDNDNDGCVDCNCAQSHQGAWWYNWCDQSNLMGPYHEKDFDKIEQYRGIYWQDWLGPNYSLKAAKMLIRPLNIDSERRR